jgi:hypothetical protein
LIDENEGVNNQQCAADFIASHGPDGVVGGWDDIYIALPYQSYGKSFPVYIGNPLVDSGQRCSCGVVNSACTL